MSRYTSISTLTEAEINEEAKALRQNIRAMVNSPKQFESFLQKTGFKQLESGKIVPVHTTR